VAAVTRQQVERALRLGADLAPWLDALDKAEPPKCPFALPPRDEAVDQLARLGVTEPDLVELLQAIPNAEAAPEWWWLLERAHQQILTDIGHWNISPTLPVLPAHLGSLGRCFWIYVFQSTTEAVHRYHLEHNVPADISWHTLADLGLHVARYRRRNGVCGLDSLHWLGLHWRGELYRLGRLQFNPYVEAGAPVLGVHIAAGAPLDPAACDESFAAAPPFFDSHFPEHASKLVTCTSWLLDEQLADYLPASSNIVRFQRRFAVLPEMREHDDEFVRWVFDRVPASLDELTPSTRLERAIVKHLSDGGHWYLRSGRLEL